MKKSFKITEYANTDIKIDNKQHHQKQILLLPIKEVLISYFIINTITFEPLAILLIIIKNVIYNHINSGKLWILENVETLRIKKCNSDIWSRIILPKTRSKFAKTPNLQICILKGIGLIAEATDFFISIISKEKSRLHYAWLHWFSSNTKSNK